jgi:AraC-like DNA-binding protein
MSAWVALYAIGAVQAALLALVLPRRADNRAANRVMALWLGLVALDLAVKALYLAEPDPALFRVFRFVALFPFLYGTLFYLFVRALTSGRGLGWRDAPHATGFVLALLLYLPLLFAGEVDNAAMFARWGHGGWPHPLAHYDLLLFGWGLSYVGAALLRMHRYRRHVRERRADADRLGLRWVEVLAVAQVVIWCIAVLHSTLHLPQVDYFLIYGAVAASMCVLGYCSLVQAAVPETGARADDHALAAAAGAPPEVAAPEDPRFPEVEARLHALMEAHALYREPALSIGQLARRSGYPEYLVSAVINRRIGSSFCDYINGLRVEAVRQRLADPGETRSILELAYDCGFTAKSTFNLAFKRQVGTTPSAYRRQATGGSAHRGQ